MIRLFSLGVVTLLLALPVRADPLTDGRLLVETVCAQCHAIGAADASPNEAAPPFREVVKRYDPSALEEALAEGVTVGHPDMPEFEFAPEEVDAVVTYLRSLRAP